MKQMKTSIIIIMLSLVIFISGCVSNPGVGSITGEAVRSQELQADETQEEVPEAVLDVAAPESSNSVCSGFGFARKKTNPDGTVEEYCYDPCKGNQECIDNFFVIEEVDFVSAPSVSNSNPSPSINVQSEETSDTSASSGDGRKKR